MSRIRTQLYRAKEKAKRRLNHIRYGKCAVLLYHRVCTPGSDPQELAVSAANFEAQLVLLKKEYRLLTVSEFEG
ncbi:MAG: hypothetical protein ACJ76F_04845, partial [Bacteroidia bacterium]